MNDCFYQKKLPLYGTFDVIICGGGPGGIGAAVAAAESGAKTLLIERFGFLGGMATSAFVNPMSEFSYNGSFVIGGIPLRFAKELIASNGAEFEEPRCNLSFNPEMYKLVAQRFVLQAGVTLLTNTSFVDCICDASNIQKIVILNNNGLSCVEGRYFIDSTGNALVAQSAEVEMLEETRPMQPGTLCFEMGGVDTSTERMHIIRQANHRFNHQAMFIRDKLLELREQGENVPQFGGPWLCTTMKPGCITLNLTRSAIDSLSTDDFDKAEQKMLEDIFTLTGYIKKFIPEFAHAYITSIAPTTGTRQGKRIKGLYVLTGKDYLDGIKFKDSIARSCHPVDIHLPNGEGQRLEFPKDAGYIPYRSLICKKYANLIMAGRNISADEDAFAAIRVQAPCMETGQAAGLAAGICLKQAIRDVKDISYEELVKLVRDYGSQV